MVHLCHRVNCTVRRNTCSSIISSSTTVDQVSECSIEWGESESERRDKSGHFSDNTQRKMSNRAQRRREYDTESENNYKCIKSYNCYLCTLFVYLLLLLETIDCNVIVNEKSIVITETTDNVMRDYQLPKMLKASLIETLLDTERRKVSPRDTPTQQLIVQHTSQSHQDALSRRQLTFERASTREDEKMKTQSTLHDASTDGHGKCVSCNVQLNQMNSQLNLKSHHPVNEKHRQHVHHLTYERDASDSTSITRINSTFATTSNESKFVYLKCTERCSLFISII